MTYFEIDCAERNRTWKKKRTEAALTDFPDLFDLMT